MAGLCTPLPTLHRWPCDQQCTARGRCGSLFLHRIGLSPTTPCRPPGAQSLISLVGVAGFEPATPSSRTRCATRAATAKQGQENYLGISIILNPRVGPTRLLNKWLIL